MRTIAAVVLLGALFLPALPGLPASPALFAQVPFEQATRDLTNPDTERRLRAVRMLKAAAYPEAAIPLAGLVTDPEDAVQYEAIAAELNIFLAEKVVPRKRVALLVEVRHKIGAEAAFSGGPFVLNGVPVPIELLAALARSSRDDNPRVALEALYALGALAGDAPADARRELLRVIGPELAGILGVPELELRVAAARVIGRVFARGRQDPPVDEEVGDAVILALNDRQRDVRLAAMDALGDMRYERSVQALTDLYQYYRHNEIGGGALQALSRIGHASSAPLFQEQVNGRSAVARIAAIGGLARAGDPGGAGEIRRALARERDERVLLAEGFSNALVGGGPLDPFFEALAKPKLRDQAMRYLLELAPERAAAFTRRAQDGVARLRADVADVLGVSRDPAALAIVESMAGDADPIAARAAARASARLRRAQ